LRPGPNRCAKPREVQRPEPPSGRSRTVVMVRPKGRRLGRWLLASGRARQWWFREGRFLISTCRSRLQSLPPHSEVKLQLEKTKDYEKQNAETEFDAGAVSRDGFGRSRPHVCTGYPRFDRGVAERPEGRPRRGSREGNELHRKGKRGLLAALSQLP